MPLDECVDLAQDRVLFHERDILRVITRASSEIAGDYPILRGNTRAPITLAMENGELINLEKLKVDMDAYVQSGVSDRAFSRAVTGGTNEDWYRHFKSGQQAKRLSASIFVGIAKAMGRDPLEYVIGADPSLRLPNATVLTSTFASLLSTVGIDPYEGERAQKLARQFPDALREMLALHDRLAVDANSSDEDGSHDLGGEPPAP